MWQQDSDIHSLLLTQAVYISGERDFLVMLRELSVHTLSHHTSALPCPLWCQVWIRRPHTWLLQVQRIVSALQETAFCFCGEATSMAS